jgi:hypothetical protein
MFWHLNTSSILQYVIRKQEPCLKINDNDNVIQYLFLRAY